MKKFVFVLLAFSLSLSAQESVLDSLEVQNLEEVIVSSVRVKDNIPIAFNNVSKEEISKRNLGQDIPILLNFLPNERSVRIIFNGKFILKQISKTSKKSKLLNNKIFLITK